MVRRVAALCLLVACVFSFQHAARAADWMTGIATFTGSEVCICDAMRRRTFENVRKRRICGPRVRKLPQTLSIACFSRM